MKVQLEIKPDAWNVSAPPSLALLFMKVQFLYSVPLRTHPAPPWEQSVELIARLFLKMQLDTSAFDPILSRPT
jgi:hypothetical protein